MPDFRRGKYGWAVVAKPDGSGDDLYRRASTVSGYLDDAGGLIDWKAAMTAFGIVRSDSMIANFRLLNWDDDKAAVKQLVQKAAIAGGAESAAEMGTAFHKLVESHHAGVQLDEDLISDQFKAALRAYLEMLDEYQLSIVGTEVRVVNDDHRIAGTADLVMKAGQDIDTPFGTVEAGTSFIGDLKTGHVSELSGVKMGMQLGIYSHSTPYDASRNERQPWTAPVTPLNRSIGLIVKVDLKAGRVEPWWLNLEEAYGLVPLAMQVASTRSSGRKLISRSTSAPATAPAKEKAPAKPPAKEIRDAIKAAETLEALETVEAEYGEFFTDAQTRLFTERKNALAAPATEDAPPTDDTPWEGQEAPEAPASPEPVDDYGPEHAKRVAAEARNVGELRSAYVTFSRNNAPAEVLSILASRAASLSEGE